MTDDPDRPPLCRRPFPAPPGCFWKRGTLYGRITVGGKRLKRSLRTADPREAAARRRAMLGHAIAERYGDTTAPMSGAERREALDRLGLSPQAAAQLLGPELDAEPVNDAAAILLRLLVAGRTTAEDVAAARRRP